jgi:hypothetical protein
MLQAIEAATSPVDAVIVTEGLVEDILAENPDRRRALAMAQSRVTRELLANCGGDRAMSAEEYQEIWEPARQALELRERLADWGQGRDLLAGRLGVDAEGGFVWSGVTEHRAETTRQEVTGFGINPQRIIEARELLALAGTLYL